MFLFFHAIGPEGENGEIKIEKNKRLAMILAFISTFLFFADFYYFHIFVSGNMGGFLARWIGGGDRLSGATNDAIVTGILLNHFWLDSYFWRFRDPGSRDWMMSRYAFLFRDRTTDRNPVY